MCFTAPENEIAAVTFFAKTSTALTNRSAFASPTNGRIPGTLLLIQCLQPRLHVAHLGFRGRRTAQFCFGLLMRCLFLDSPPFAPLDS